MQHPRIRIALFMVILAALSMVDCESESEHKAKL